MHAVITLAEDRDEWVASRSGRFHSRRKSLPYILDTNLGGPQSRSGEGGGGKRPAPYQESKSIRRLSRLYLSHCTDRAIQTYSGICRTVRAYYQAIFAQIRFHELSNMYYTYIFIYLLFNDCRYLRVLRVALNHKMIRKFCGVKRFWNNLKY
jgi:hypothetical protein